MLSKEVSSTIFKVFDMTQPEIEPRSPGPLANTVPNWPMSWLKISQRELIIKKKINKSEISVFSEKMFNSLEHLTRYTI